MELGKDMGEEFDETTPTENDLVGLTPFKCILSFLMAKPRKIIEAHDI